MKLKIGKKNVNIYFQHHRPVWYDERGPHIHNHGGMTEAYVLDKKGNRTSAYAKCHKEDVYNKKMGRVIAAGKLFKQLGLPTKVALTL